MAKKEFNFTQKFNELEKITQELENGDLDLEVSLKQFEKGLKIASELKRHLNEAENKIKTLKKNK
ncbi:MAG: exodeoxyribonuclease VII small subunit [Patescibacteria group bacterium]|jgi:exodeoxyribonuclease VII small subunit